MAERRGAHERGDSIVSASLWALLHLSRAPQSLQEKMTRERERTGRLECCRTCTTPPCSQHGPCLLSTPSVAPAEPLAANIGAASTLHLQQPPSHPSVSAASTAAAEAGRCRRSRRQSCGRVCPAQSSPLPLPHLQLMPLAPATETTPANATVTHAGATARGACFPGLSSAAPLAKVRHVPVLPPCLANRPDVQLPVVGLPNNRTRQALAQTRW